MFIKISDIIEDLTTRDNNMRHPWLKWHNKPGAGHCQKAPRAHLHLPSRKRHRGKSRNEEQRSLPIHFIPYPAILVRRSR